MATDPTHTSAQADPLRALGTRVAESIKALTALGTQIVDGKIAADEAATQFARLAAEMSAVADDAQWPRDMSEHVEAKRKARQAAAVLDAYQERVDGKNGKTSASANVDWPADMSEDLAKRGR